MADWIQYVHPDVMYTEEPVADEDNAFCVWQRIDATSLWGSSNLPGAGRNVYSLSPSFSLEDATHWEQWLESKSELLALFDSGSRRGHLRFPTMRQDRVEAVVSNAVDAKLLEAEARAVKGDMTAAADELRDVCRAIDLIRSTSFASAWTHDQKAHRGMCRLAARRWCAEPTLQRLLPLLKKRVSPVAEHIEWLRYWFHRRFLRAVVTFPEGDATKLAKALSEPWRWAFGPIPLPNDAASGADGNDANGQLAEELELILRGHDDPLDKRATVELASELVSEHMDRLRRGWPIDATTPPAEVMEVVRVWPEALWVVAGESQEFSEKDLVGIRHALGPIKNPVGRMLIHKNLTYDLSGHLSSTIVLRIPYYHAADLYGTLCVLALRIYERRKGTLPPSLRDLVAEGILEELPLDSFSGRPFHYSMKDRVLWSVGPEGDVHPVDKDDIRLVWRLPKLR